MTYATQRPLTEDEKAELAGLNAAVGDAIEARRAWLDAKMHECSTLQVGDDIYDVDSGRRLGKVSRLYRYWSGRDDLLDDGPSCSYEYETRPLCFDNTSSQVGVSFGTRDDAIERAEMRMSALRSWPGVSQ